MPGSMSQCYRCPYCDHYFTGNLRMLKWHMDYHKKMKPVFSGSTPTQTKSITKVTIKKTSNDEDIDSKALRFKEKFKKSFADVLKSLNHSNLPLQNVKSEERENKLKKSDYRPRRKSNVKTPMKNEQKTWNAKLSTPYMSDKMLDETIDKIPTSTHKRKLFNKSLPISDSGNMSSDYVMDLTQSPIQVLNKFIKLHKKK